MKAFAFAVVVIAKDDTIKNLSGFDSRIKNCIDEFKGYGIGEVSVVEMDMVECGHDLTDFGTPDEFESIIKELGLEYKGVVQVKDTSPVLAHEWSSPLLTIHTGNNPITGEYAGGGRQNDIGYASYMGATGLPHLIQRWLELVEERGTAKGTDPTSRSYI